MLLVHIHVPNKLETVYTSYTYVVHVYIQSIIMCVYTCMVHFRIHVLCYILVHRGTIDSLDLMRYNHYNYHTHCTCLLAQYQ